MGIFDFIKSLSSRAEQDKARAEFDKALVALDIDVAIGAHQNWKTRLDAYLGGRSSEDLRPERICADDCCDLGKWIYSSGAEQLGRYPIFGELRAVHKMFHHQASSVVALHQSGKSAEARALLDGEYSKTSGRIIRRLQDLKLLNGAHD